MEPKDQVPAALLGLYALTSLLPIVWTGMNIGLLGLMAGIGVAGSSPKAEELAVFGVLGVIGLFRLVTALAATAYAVFAAWRTSQGDPSLNRSAGLVALAVSVLSLLSSMCLDCMGLVTWILPVAFALLATVLAMQGSTAGHGAGWSAER